MKRYFEFVDAKSSKFWEVWIEGTTIFTRFGRIGVNGQTPVKSSPTATGAGAGEAGDEAIGEKIKKGYLEGSSDV